MVSPISEPSTVRPAIVTYTDFDPTWHLTTICSIYSVRMIPTWWLLDVLVGWVQIEKRQKIQKYGKESASDWWISGSKYIQRFKDLEKKNTLNYDRTWLKTKRKEDDIIMTSSFLPNSNKKRIRTTNVLDAGLLSFFPSETKRLLFPPQLRWRFGISKPCHWAKNVLWQLSK